MGAFNEIRCPGGPYAEIRDRYDKTADVITDHDLTTCFHVLDVTERFTASFEVPAIGEYGFNLSVATNVDVDSTQTLTVYTGSASQFCHTGCKNYKSCLHTMSTPTGDLVKQSYFCPCHLCKEVFLSVDSALSLTQTTLDWKICEVQYVDLEEVCTNI